MSKKYSYSKTITTTDSVETLTAVEFDSFDEAIKAVEKGVSERKFSQIPKVKEGPAIPSAKLNAPTPGGSKTSNPLPSPLPGVDDHILD